MERRLKLDLGRSIAEFQSVARYLELRTKVYRRLFRGKGLEFDGFRMFGPDDDASDIDWKTSSRAGRLLVKQYKEERKLSFLFVVDVGDDMVFGSQAKLKCEYAAELAISFMHLVYEIGDKAGLIMYGPDVKDFIPPIARRGAIDYLTDSLTNASLYGGPSSLRKALQYVITHITGSLAAVIFISDFARYEQSTESLMRTVANQYETIAVLLRDPLDMTLPDVNEEILIEDPLSGERLTINPKIARKEYERFAAAQLHSVRQSLNHSGVDTILLTTAHSFALPLAQFLEDRVRRKLF